MKRYSLSHLADHVLLHELRAHVGHERTATADVLAHLAEVEERRLYLPAAYSSMHAWCVGELHFSEDAAFRRIRAARAAREFPAIFAAVADGRLNLGGVLLLKTHLRPDTVDELIAAAAHMTRPEIEQLLAQRFPQADLPAQVEVVGPASPALQLAPAPVGAPSGQDAPGHVAAPAPRAKLAPLSPERYALQVTIGQETRDKLRRAQELLGHAVPSGDLAQVLDRALDALLVQLEKRKFTATSRPGPWRRSTNERHVPADVRRRTEQTRKAVVARARPEAAEDPTADKDVTPWLRVLGFRTDEARRAAALCDEVIPDASLEERVKFACSSFGSKGVRRVPAPPRAACD